MVKAFAKKTLLGPNRAIAKSGQAWKPALCTTHGALFQGDCIAFLKNVPDEMFDCIFADPPFNLGKKYGSRFSDKSPKEKYIEWCELWIRECSRVLKPGGAFFVYALPELAYQFANQLNDSLEFRHWIALTMKCSFPVPKRLYPAHYALLYFTKGKPKTFVRLRIPIQECRHCGKDLKDYGGHRKHLNPAGLSLSDFWDDTSPNRHEKSKFRKGINELSLTIPERAILMSTNPGDIVFDPFGGGGTTFEAAQTNGRRWIGTEISTVAAIKRRMRRRFPATITTILPEFFAASPANLVQFSANRDATHLLRLGQKIRTRRIGQPH